MNRWIHVRKHRGGLADSMITHATILATQEMVDNYFFDSDYPDITYRVEPYTTRPDERISWPCTWIVMHPNGYPVGFCSGDIDRPVDVEMP